MGQAMGRSRSRKRRPERRVFVEDVLHSKGNRRVIQPGAPSTGTVLGGGDGHNVFLLAVGHIQILTAILGKARTSAGAGGGRLNV